MTRSRARQIALQISFAASGSDQNPAILCDEILTEEYLRLLMEDDETFKDDPQEQDSYIRKLTSLVYENKDDLDQIIDRYSEGWKISRISSMTKEILRCAICEIRFIDDVPEKVAINEAVELSKRFAESESSAFINGILGRYVRESSEHVEFNE